MSAAVLKYWREAASLILTHCRKSPSLKVSNPSTVVEAETLTPTFAQKEELEVLVLKRSAKSSFMPELYVFPGGTADNADFSRKWLQLFGALSPTLIEERFGFSKTIARHAPMFYRKRDPDFAAMPSEVAFRISAIRETFEESGVLLARNIGDTDFKHNTKPTTAFTFGSDHENKVEEWRKRVMRNPEEFLKLCKTSDIVPDIWALYDWSNWLTPNYVGNNLQTAAKRFDAAFFICCLDKEPYVAEDETELVHSVWVSPHQIMEDYSENRVQLAPPQLYEACRLVNFQTMEELLQFCQSRVGQPLDRWMPVRIQCADAIIYTFPGDSLYPEKPDVEGESPILQREETLQELMQKSTHLHRAVAALPPEESSGVPRAPARFQLQCNISELPFGQCTPRLK